MNNCSFNSTVPKLY